MGNESGGPGSVTGTAGYESFYVGADWQINEKWKLSGFYTTHDGG
jgi:hypothetical protein